MDTPQILTKAANIIGERGWFQGASVDPDGTGVCAVGAMRVAVGLNPLPDDYVPADEEDVDHASEEFVQWLGIYAMSVVDWNDSPRRTKEQVITALRECAAELNKAGA
jgi:hypothetical protein